MGDYDHLKGKEIAVIARTFNVMGFGVGYVADIDREKGIVLLSPNGAHLMCLSKGQSQNHEGWYNKFDSVVRDLERGLIILTDPNTSFVANQFMEKACPFRGIDTKNDRSTIEQSQPQDNTADNAQEVIEKYTPPSYRNRN